MVNYKYYDGYEGEDEYIIYYLNKGGTQEGLSIWGGIGGLSSTGRLFPII